MPNQVQEMVALGQFGEMPEDDQNDQRAAKQIDARNARLAGRAAGVLSTRHRGSEGPPP